MITITGFVLENVLERLLKITVPTNCMTLLHVTIIVLVFGEGTIFPPGVLIYTSPFDIE